MEITFLSSFECKKGWFRFSILSSCTMYAHRLTKTIKSNEMTEVSHVKCINSCQKAPKPKADSFTTQLYYTVHIASSTRRVDFEIHKICEEPLKWMDALWLGSRYYLHYTVQCTMLMSAYTFIFDSMPILSVFITLWLWPRENVHKMKYKARARRWCSAKSWKRPKRKQMRKETNSTPNGISWMLCIAYIHECTRSNSTKKYDVQQRKKNCDHELVWTASAFGANALLRFKQ